MFEAAKTDTCALVPYFRNQIGERVVFTEDEDNPYYKQASPGITDYFPSVQDKQKKGNLFLEPKQSCKAALGKYKATFTLTTSLARDIPVSCLAKLLRLVEYEEY